MSYRMMLLRAVREWTGPKPSELGFCEPRDDLTYIVALWRTDEKMRSVEQAEMEREMKRKHGAT